MTDSMGWAAPLKAALPAVTDAIQAALAPQGRLRAGISLSNFLLVTNQKDDGTPEGVSPSLAAVLADVLGVGVDYQVFDSPGAVADAAEANGWDIGNIGADPARAAFIRFTDAYCEIESTCLVPANSVLQSFADVDQPGVCIASKHRSAYTLWLERNLKHATLKLYDSVDASFEGFVDEKLDALAGLKPRLLSDVERLPGARLLPDKFAAVQQAIGTPSDRAPCGAEFLQRFVTVAKQSGLVQALIDHHGVTGKLSVAAGDDPR